MGLATAKALGAFGPVLVGGRNQTRLDKALEELRKTGIEAYGKTCDISDRASLDEFAKYAASLAPLGNVVNAAGVDAGGADLIIGINMGGTVNFVEAFLPYIEGARLVNFSSITGYFYTPAPEEIEIWNNPNDEGFVEKVKAFMASKPIPERMKYLGEDYIYYPASKAFTIYYTKANTLRFGKKNAQIFSIAPGAFDTPMLREQSEEQIANVARGTAFGRLGDPDEMADFIVHLLSDGHDYLTGCDIILDGGKAALTLTKQLD